jgi:hypothetical protein
MCRRCGKEPERIQHITAGCEQLTPTEYIKRHDGVAKVIHQKLAEAAELIEDKCPYCKYKPAHMLENDNFKLYWNRSIIMDKTIPSNRPDITFMNKKTKNTFLIDIATPDTHSLTKTTPKHIYTDANSGNSWHMFNCKKFPKLHTRPPSLILLMKYPRIGEYFPAKAEK